MSAKDVQEPTQVDVDLNKNIGRAVANIQKRHPEKIKTSLCKFFAAGNCQRGEKCTFKARRGRPGSAAALAGAGL